ncbi:MAG: hypothetical protein QXT57_01820 [Thermosphaera sp.]
MSRHLESLAPSPSIRVYVRELGYDSRLIAICPASEGGLTYYGLAKV